MFSGNEYDLLLQFDSEHFKKNADVIDNLHTGDIIDFMGYITRLSVKN
jgi:signal-transduction protein with cAMP-binding, CBS, and nucleotidyltransferase domain